MLVAEYQKSESALYCSRFLPHDATHNPTQSIYHTALCHMASLRSERVRANAMCLYLRDAEPLIDGCACRRTDSDRRYSHGRHQRMRGERNLQRIQTFTTNKMIMVASFLFLSTPYAVVQ